MNKPFGKIKRKEVNMKCKFCKTKFIQKRFLVPFCLQNDECIAAFRIFAKDATEKANAKKWSRDKAVMKADLMTKGDWIKIAQTHFNTYIRLRDAHLPCVSCGCNMQGKKGDASHFYATTYSFLRFNESNVHLSCVHCNQHLSGNIHEYRPRLIKRIGLEMVEWLDANCHNKLEITIEEIKELTLKYKAKIKNLNH